MDVAEYLVRGLQKKGADDVVVSASEHETKQVKFSNSAINGSLSYVFSDMSIFASFNKRTVSTSLRECTRGAAQKLIEKIAGVVPSLPRNKEYRAIASGSFRYPRISERYDHRIKDIEPVSVVEESISAAERDGIRKAAGVFMMSESSEKLLTSNGIEQQGKGTHFYFSIRSLKSHDASGHATASSNIFKKLDFKGAGGESAAIAQESRDPEQCPEGKFQVLFSPLAFAPLLAHTGNSASVYSLESGFSFFPKKIGSKMGNAKINIFDDGTLSNGGNSGAYDDEGHPAQKTTIIDEGKLNSFLHNTSTALRHKTLSTGNAGIIAPEASNVILENGEQSREEMIRSIRNGILITNVWYTRFNNYLTGEFSTLPRDGAWLIENGKITKPVHKFRISSSLSELYHNVAALGKESRQIESWECEQPVMLPHVLVDKVNVTRPS
ncbi:TldD/PmbA family protein [Candidatus Woesearchaeota archaeon]|nr:TldD/PmbA family protein [Candidatus Woesearchaeota archaeon]